MFSDNKRISGRQMFRLFLFNLAGLSSLVLPAQLARLTGAAGWLCIVTGGCLGVLYLALLAKTMDKLNTDLLTWLRNGATPVRLLASGFLCVYCILTGAYCLEVFSEVMRENLVSSERFWVVMAVILAVAGYAVAGGLESWARIYEILFWFVFLPLLLMLALGAVNVNPAYWVQTEMVDPHNIWRGSYLVFLFLEISFWALFFPECMGADGRRRRSNRGIGASLVIVTVFLLVIYQIVLGSFGAGALSKLPYPAVTLMSTIQVSGNFIKRLDAVMLGVWFFTLFALLTLMLFFGAKMAQLFLGDMPGHMERSQTSGRAERRKQWYLVGVMAAIAVLALAGHRSDAVQELYQGYILYLGAPFLVLFPAGVCIWA